MGVQTCNNRGEVSHFLSGLVDGAFSGEQRLDYSGMVGF